MAVMEIDKVNGAQIPYQEPQTSIIDFRQLD